MLREELGTLKESKVHVDPLVTPQMCKARPVLYAMRQGVEELDHRKQQGVLECMQLTDGTAPSVRVPVLKGDRKSQRICGDFGNAVSRLDAYPILRVVEDLCSKLSGGRSNGVFMAKTVVYLGHETDQEGQHPMEDALEAVQGASNPQKVAETVRTVKCELDCQMGGKHRSPSSSGHAICRRNFWSKWNFFSMASRS